MKVKGQSKRRIVRQLQFAASGFLMTVSYNYKCKRRAQGHKSQVTGCSSPSTLKYSFTHRRRLRSRSVSAVTAHTGSAARASPPRPPIRRRDVMYRSPCNLAAPTATDSKRSSHSTCLKDSEDPQPIGTTRTHAAYRALHERGRAVSPSLQDSSISVRSF